MDPRYATRMCQSSGGDLLTLFFTATSPFSNHHPARIVVSVQVEDGETSQPKEFSCAEHYYMFEKAMFARDLKTAQMVLGETDPKRIKQLGSSIERFNRSQWRPVSVDVMRRALTAKFSQNETLRRQLLATSNSRLVECSPTDVFWGIGENIDCLESIRAGPWRGRNLLGQLLGEVRSALRANAYFTADVQWAESVRLPSFTAFTADSQCFSFLDVLRGGFLKPLTITARPLLEIGQHRKPFFTPQRSYQHANGINPADEQQQHFFQTPFSAPQLNRRSQSTDRKSVVGSTPQFSRSNSGRTRFSVPSAQLSVSPSTSAFCIGPIPYPPPPQVSQRRDAVYNLQQQGNGLPLKTPTLPSSSSSNDTEHELRRRSGSEKTTSRESNRGKRTRHSDRKKSSRRHRRSRSRSSSSSTSSSERRSSSRRKRGKRSRTRSREKEERRRRSTGEGGKRKRSSSSSPKGGYTTLPPLSSTVSSDGIETLDIPLPPPREPFIPAERLARSSVPDDASFAN